MSGKDVYALVQKALSSIDRRTRVLEMSFFYKFTSCTRVASLFAIVPDVNIEPEDGKKVRGGSIVCQINGSK